MGSGPPGGFFRVLVALVEKFFRPERVTVWETDSVWGDSPKISACVSGVLSFCGVAFLARGTGCIRGAGDRHF